MNILSRNATQVSLFLFPSEKGFIGSKSFPFEMGLGAKKGKQEVTKDVALVKL